MSFVSLTQRFAVWFVLVSLLPMLLIGYSLLRSFENELQKTVARQISVIADKKEDQIDYYLRSLVHDLNVLVQGRTAPQAAQDLAGTFTQGGAESAAYRQLDTRYRDFFKRFVEIGNYYDLFLISPQGTVVYSQAHEADFATNLFTGPYRDTALAKVARNVRNTLENSISDFENYGPSGNKIAAFIAVPIMNQGRIEGILAIQIDSDSIFQVLLDNTGMGDSGETVVARLEDERTALAVAPLKYDADAALKHRILLTDLNRGAPLIHALNGERGSGFEIDYLGQPVAAAWRYLPRMGWGMVVKMDADEALAPVYRLRIYALIIMGMALAVAMLGAFLLGRRIVNPLKNLSHSAQDLANGKLDQRVPVVGRDELGQLAVSFNDMAEHLQSSYEGLERRVEQRTTDLTLALKQGYEAQKALQISAERLNEAQRTAKVGSWELNLLTGELFWTDEIFRLFEIDKNQFGATYEAFLHAIHPDDRDSVNQAYTDSLANRMPYEITHRLLMKDGRIKWVQERCSSDFDAEGKPIMSAGTVQDVTGLMQTELALKQLNEELEQRVEQRTELLLAAKEEADRANNAKSEFLSRMSHELRTPMNAIMGFSQLLETDQEHPLTPDQLDNIHEIRHAGQHLLELINEVLDLARIESGRIDLSLEPVEVPVLIDECVALLQPMVAGQQIELTLDTGNACTVQADRLRLRQVLLNLLSNAVKYNRKGGSVQIACRPVQEGIVRIMVSDSGRGISADALPRLFKPFERMESAYDGIEGTGIGLALSKRLVEAMDGAIGVESVVGEGSVFWADLPVPVAEAAVGAPSASDGAEAARNTYATVRTLLYVEDNPANLRLVQKIISTQTGLKLLDARSAELGLEIARTQQPDLILLDINLPGMDGFEALRHLQNDPATSGIPVVAVSANAMERDVKKGLAAGFVDYLTKPLDIPKLLTLLGTIFK